MFEDDRNTNQKTYTDRDVVYYYAQLSRLQPAEQTILELLRGQGSTMAMLDIGVGAGRTTPHFSPVVNRYVGIDYSAEMIAACHQRFGRSPASTSFEVCDARDMSRFDDNSFDFILFSFNGIDYISHGDRLAVLQEVRRVGKSGGYFFFSSHNLQGIEQAFAWKKQLSLNPVSTYTNLVMLALLRFLNRPLSLSQLNAADYAVVKDESHNFRLSTYYIRPQAQIRQLQQGFEHIRVYSWQDGQEITSRAALQGNTEMWLYYLCTIQ